MRCCSTCFGDRGLKKKILFISDTQGNCSYCGAENECLIDPSALGDDFRALITAYAQSETGQPLTYWLRRDWALFSSCNIDDAHAQVLLADILNDGQIVRQKFAPISSVVSDNFGTWEKLRSELLHENRFFPNTQIDLDRLEALLSRLAIGSGEFPPTWYRARIQADGNVLSANELLAPPPKVATHGRANPAGIPYLYLGSQIQTAASEVRAHTGEWISVAEFTIDGTLEFIDLRNPRRSVSPFSLADMFEDEEDIAQLRSDVDFLEKLGLELTRPVLPQAAAFDYTPSQYLCEFIKKCGYDGVLYNSSVSEGINLALFKPQKATVGNVRQFVVEKASVVLRAG